MYPEVDIRLKVNVSDDTVTGDTICSGVTAADISCTVDLPRDVYNISITQSNDIGSAVDSAVFDSKLCTSITER